MGLEHAIRIYREYVTSATPINDRLQAEYLEIKNFMDKV